MCKGKAFLLSRASFSVDDEPEYKTPRFIDSAKQNIEVHHGAKAAAGYSGRFLLDAGFTSNNPLGLKQLVETNDLLLHHDREERGLIDNGHDFWIDALAEYAEATKHGVLIMAVKPEYLLMWGKAMASLKEVEEIPNGRVHAYIEDMRSIQTHSIHKHAPKTHTYKHTHVHYVCAFHTYI